MLSKNNIEDKLSNYIDALNNEQETDIFDTANDPELEN